MKQLLILATILLSSTLFVKGQSSVYRPFPMDNGNWSYQYFDDLGFPTATYSQYTLTGDTVISSNTYKKIYSYPFYSGAIRELGKIIYFVPNSSSTEYILYNFNLNLGDTIFNPYGGSSCSNDTIIIVQVDSVLVSDGFHRRLQLSSSTTWIEGIGSSNYLLQPTEFLCTSGNFELQCMTSDLIFSYPDSTSNCSVSVLQLDNTLKNLSIYPVPTSNNIYLNFSYEDLQSSQYDIYITDLFGNIIEHYVNMRKIDITKLKSGIYFIKIKNQNQQNIFTSKIIKL